MPIQSSCKVQNSDPLCDNRNRGLTFEILCLYVTNIDLHKDIRVCFVMAKLTTEAFYIDLFRKCYKKKEE